MTTKANTGADNTTYNLLSVLYHALQGAETYEMYINDAEQSGDTELAQYFRDVRNENTKRAERGKQLLSARLNQDQAQGKSA